MSLRDTILNATDISTESVDVPEWGVTVEMRGMTAKQRMRLVDSTNAKTRDYSYSDILIELTFDPDTGEPVFDAADREALADKSGAVQEMLAQVAIRLSSVTSDEAEAAVESDPTSDGS